MSVRVPFPRRGKNRNYGATDQPQETTAEALNVRAIDSDGSTRGAVRSGLSGYSPSEINGAGVPVKDLQLITYDQKTVDYSGLGASGEDPLVELPLGDRTNPGQTTPSLMAPKAAAKDPYGNVYALDGNTGVVKVNADGVVQYRIALPTTNPAHFVRAIAADEEGGVYIGVSGVSGTEGLESAQEDARCYKFQEQIDGPPLEEWAIDALAQTNPDEPEGVFWEELRLDGGRLYAGQNDPAGNAAYVRVYSLINTSNPQLEREVKLGYPLHGVDVRSDDGAVFAALFANADRGENLTDEALSITSKFWTLEDLDRSGERVWSKLSAKNIDGLKNSTLEDGDEVTFWADTASGLRNLFSIGAGFNPIYVEQGPTGQPCVRFDGVNDRLDSLTNPSTTKLPKSLHRTVLPGYTGHKWAVVMLVRCDPADSVPRWLFTQETTTGVPFQVRVNTDNSTSTLRNGWVYAGNENAGLQFRTGYYDRFGRYSSNGYMLLTWIWHNGDTTQDGGGSSNCLRVNGRPISRWNGPAAGLASTAAFQLGGRALGGGGLSNFKGDVMEIRVLSDFSADDADQENIVQHPRYPTVAYGDATYGHAQTEIEKIEGEIMHEYGLAHLLPTGKNVHIDLNNGGNTPANGNTLTVGPITYRYQTAPSQAYDISLAGGPSAATITARTVAAINAQDTTGTSYFVAGTEPNPVAMVVNLREDPNLPVNTTTQFMLTGLRPDIDYTVSKSGGTAWLGSLTVPFTPADDGTSAFVPGACSVWPHTYNLYSGPPSLLDNSEQIGRSLTEPGAMLVKLSSELAHVWVMYDNQAENEGRGGLGSGVRVFGRAVFSTGKRSTATRNSPTTEQTAQMDADVRRVQDGGATFVDSIVTPTDAWVSRNMPGEIEYDWPRMDVDQYGNLAVPWADSTGNITAAVFLPEGADLVGLTYGQELIRYDPAGTVIAFVALWDPTETDYGGDLAPGTERGELLWVFVEGIEGSELPKTIHKLQLVEAVPNGNSPRATRALAVAGGDIKRFTTSAVTLPAGPDTLPAGQHLSATAELPVSTVAFGNVFYTDGVVYRYYDPRTDEVLLWSAMTGKLPPRCRLMATWGGRVVLARSAGQDWYMSRIGDPFDWDFHPPDITPDQAVAGADSRAGVCPDIINTLIPVNDDLLLIGGDHTIQRMTGNPMEGGVFDVVTDKFGLGFGPCWSRDERGALYAFSPTNGLYLIAPDGSGMQPLTQDTVPDELRGIDYSLYYVRLEWNPVDRGCHVFVMPKGSGGVVVDHLFWDGKNLGPWPDRFGLTGNTTRQPTASMLFDGDDADDRRLLIGCEDGFVRMWDPAAKNDDGVPILSKVRFGPWHNAAGATDIVLRRPRVALADDQYGATLSVLTGTSADRPQMGVLKQDLDAGMNAPSWLRARAPYVWLELSSRASGRRWAFESMSVELMAGGSVKNA